MKKLFLDKPFVSAVMYGENKAPVVYEVADILIAALRNPPREGATYDVMEERVSLIRNIKEAEKNKKEFVWLENSEHKTLCQCLRTHRFPFVDPALFDFINNVSGLPDIKVEAVAESQ